MSSQTTDLFGHIVGHILREAEARTLHRANDPDTSREAAVAIASKRTRIQAEVLAFARAAGGLGFTDFALCCHFEDLGSTYRTRRAELTRAGEIVDSGHRSLSDNGRRMIVWIHKDFAPKKEAAA